MPTLLKETRPTARKEHRCHTCRGRIAVGVRYSRESYVYDGRVYDFVTCLPCTSLTADVYDWAGAPEEGVALDSYQEWATDNPEDERAQAYLRRLYGHPCLLCSREDATHQFSVLGGPDGWLCEDHKDSPVVLNGKDYGTTQRRYDDDE